MNKKYFNYLFNSKKTAIVFIGISYLLLYLATFISSTSTFSSRQRASLATILIAGFVLSLLLVPVMFNYVHSKKAVDTYFSLPISRKEQIITSQLFIDLVIVTPVVILTLVSMFMAIINGECNILAYLLIIICFVVSIITVVAFNTTTYLQAYSTFDGVVIMIAYLLIPALIVFVIENFVSAYIYGFHSIDVKPFLNLTSIIYSSGYILADLVGTCTRATMNITYPIHYVVCVLWHLLVSVVVLKKDYINRAVEKAENVSDKLTAYPIMINLFTFSILAVITTLLVDFDYEEYVIFFVLLFVLFEIANCVYRRKIKIYIKDVVSFVVASVLAILVGYICFKTEGFGMSKKYLKDPINVQYNLYQHDYENSDSKLIGLINQKYNDAYSVSLRISASIPSNKMDENKELIEFFEKLREKSIDEYYANSFISYDRYINGSLSVYNNMDEDPFGIASDIYGPDIIQYNYQRYNYIDFSLEELEYLDKYCDVTISFATPWDWYDVELKELLEK